MRKGNLSYACQERVLRTRLWYVAVKDKKDIMMQYKEKEAMWGNKINTYL